MEAEYELARHDRTHDNDTIFMYIYLFTSYSSTTREYAYSYSTRVVAVLCVLSTMHTCMDTYSSGSTTSIHPTHHTPPRPLFLYSYHPSPVLTQLPANRCPHHLPLLPARVLCRPQLRSYSGEPSSAPSQASFTSEIAECADRGKRPRRKKSSFVRL